MSNGEAIVWLLGIAILPVSTHNTPVPAAHRLTFGCGSQGRPAGCPAARACHHGGVCHVAAAMTDGQARCVACRTVHDDSLCL